MELTQKLKPRHNALSVWDEQINDCLEYNHSSGIFHFFMVTKMHHSIDSSSNIIRMKDAEYIITRSIPKKLAFRFLEEMEQLKMIKIKDKQNIILLK